MLFQFIFIILGIFLSCNSIFLVFFMNFNTGLVLALLLGLVFLFYGIYFKRINEFMASGVLKMIRYVAYAGLLFMLITISVIMIYGKNDTATYKEDALIVLGSAVHGKEVSKPLKSRLDRAVEYHQKNPEAIIIVSGSQGPQEEVTEAYAMEQYLIKAGVEEDLIIKEEKATSTFENFKYSKDILDRKFTKDYTLSFITNDFHIYRSSQLAKNAGLITTYVSAPMEWYSQAVHYLREFLAVIKLWVFKV